MKKLICLLVCIILVNLNTTEIYSTDKDIDSKLNKFISNQIESKQILSYIDCNFSKLEDRSIRKNVINKFINYNKNYIKTYQSNFNIIIESEINNIQSKQNLKSEINSLNKLCKYEDIYMHKFRFIDNKPELVKALKDIYCSGYKVNFIDRKFIVEVNYEFLTNAY